MLKAGRILSVCRLFTAVLLCFLFASCNSVHTAGSYQSIVKKAGLLPGKKLLVVVFINPECPITQKYTRTLNELSNELKQSTCFIGVIPGKLFDDKSIAAFKKEYAFKIPVIKDEQYKITRALSAKVYPEVILLNSESERLYSGKIDNWYESIGNNRPAPTEFYLKDAITSYLQNGTVKTDSTEPVGCYINTTNN